PFCCYFRSCIKGHGIERRLFVRNLTLLHDAVIGASRDEYDLVQPMAIEGVDAGPQSSIIDLAGRFRKSFRYRIADQARQKYDVSDTRERPLEHALVAHIAENELVTRMLEEA